jgi:hypothetical protein
VHHREDGVTMSRDLVVVSEDIAVDLHDGRGARSGSGGGGGYLWRRGSWGSNCFLGRKIVG